MDKKSDQPDHQDHILALCHMLSNRIGKAFSSELHPFGLTAVEWRVMLTLGLLESASGQEITSRWAIEKMAVSRSIAALQGRGLVTRQQNNTDRRRFDLKLTKKGKALCLKILPIANQRYHELLSCLEHEEIINLRDSVIKMIIHIDNIIE